MRYMVSEIIGKLQFANASAINPDDFSLEQYEDLHDLYVLVMKQKQFSISEMEAIAAELGSMRANDE